MCEWTPPPELDPRAYWCMRVSIWVYRKVVDKSRTQTDKPHFLQILKLHISHTDK